MVFFESVVRVRFFKGYFLSNLNLLFFVLGGWFGVPKGSSDATVRSVSR